MRLVPTILVLSLAFAGAASALPSTRDVEDRARSADAPAYTLQNRARALVSDAAAFGAYVERCRHGASASDFLGCADEVARRAAKLQERVDEAELKLDEANPDAVTQTLATEGLAQLESETEVLTAWASRCRGAVEAAADDVQAAVVDACVAKALAHADTLKARALAAHEMLTAAAATRAAGLKADAAVDLLKLRQAKADYAKAHADAKVALVERLAKERVEYAQAKAAMKAEWSAAKAAAIESCKTAANKDAQKACVEAQLADERKAMNDRLAELNAEAKVAIEKARTVVKLDHRSAIFQATELYAKHRAAIKAVDARAAEALPVSPAGAIPADALIGVDPVVAQAEATVEATANAAADGALATVDTALAGVPA